MKKFCVFYNTTTSFEAVVKAKTKKEAKEKVREVIGEPVVIEKIWELKYTEKLKENKNAVS